MEEKRLYFLAEFDDETESILSGHYRKLTELGFVGSQTKGIPYHITLGDYDVGCEKQLARDMDNICRCHSEINIRLGYLGLFGLSVLFIAPNSNFELFSLVEGFNKSSCRGRHNWVPHVTMLIDEPEAIQKALPELAKRFEPVNAKITKVELYEFFPKRFIKACNLGE